MNVDARGYIFGIGNGFHVRYQVKMSFVMLIFMAPSIDPRKGKSHNLRYDAFAVA